jgi:folate-binding protein YgfZ
VTTRVLGISTGPISSQRQISGRGSCRPEPDRFERASERGVSTEPRRRDVHENGNAFAELAGWRTVAVRGADARGWLHDLVTADVQGLPEGHTRRSLLLTPTGRIRADFHVAWVGGSFLLLQPPGQSQAVDEILAPYVLSSDVELDDLSERCLIVAILGGVAAEDGDGALVVAPSVLGSGHDVILSPGEPARRLRERLRRRGLVEMTEQDLETWRIRRGDVRMGADFGPDALPAEAGLEVAIDFTKGCFLGQESVAKVRNLGHPPWVLRHVRSRTPVAPGAPVLAGGVAIGEVTSAAEADGGTDAIVRVRWDPALEPLSTATGPLSLRREG